MRQDEYRAIFNTVPIYCIVKLRLQLWLFLIALFLCLQIKQNRVPLLIFLI